MGAILKNQRISDSLYLMEVADFREPISDPLHSAQPTHQSTPIPGQFYMLRGWDEVPVLSRPISVFDADRGSVSFLYDKVGKGTAILSQMKRGDFIEIQGPLGNGFPLTQSSDKLSQAPSKLALVGGGVGIAPLFFAAKEYGKLYGKDKVSLFLGFREEAVLEERYKALVNDENFHINIGGFVTDEISPGQFDAIWTCGPLPMMKALYEKCKKTGVADRLYVSMENRMACGIGTCLVCTCATASGNKKVCKDGPVFPAVEVF